MYFTIQGKLVNLSSPIIMGIINITPDSFFDGAKDKNVKDYLLLADNMVQQGAHILDLGAVSTRPGAATVPHEEEWSRLEPILNVIRKKYSNIIISVDTVSSYTAKKAANVGADIINDISGGQMDDNMFTTMAELDISYVLTHIQGTPETMQHHVSYKNLFEDITMFFSKQIDILYRLGVKNIILDPGFGFAKSLEDNYKILHFISCWKELFNIPILVGISRKSIIYKLLNISPQEALNGSTALHAILINNGANILRVHDIKEARETIQILQQYKSASLS